MKKQSEICPICAVLMEFVKDNKWLRCRICGFMCLVSKRIITPIGNK